MVLNFNVLKKYNMNNILNLLFSITVDKNQIISKKKACSKFFF